MVPPGRLSQHQLLPLPEQDPSHVRHVPEVAEGLRPACQAEEPPRDGHLPQVHLHDLGTRQGHGASGSRRPCPLRPDR